MADNIAQYGFRWYCAADGGRAMPTPERCIVASAESFDVTGGGSNVQLRPGDPVYKLSTGGVTLCPGAETTAVPPYGIVVGIGPYWNGSEMVDGRALPSDTTYGTNLARQSTVFVIPANAGIWEIDCDDAVTATTQATYQALQNSNINYILTGATNNGYAYPKADISTTATTNSLVLRIHEAPSPTARNEDLSGANVKILVRFNLVQHPAFGSVSQPTQNSTTGV